jgi:hypothetical protein
MKQILPCETSKLFFFFTERLMKISRYFDMLTTSFSIMEDGMMDQYEVQKAFLRAVFKAPVSINEFSTV